MTLALANTAVSLAAPGPEGWLVTAGEVNLFLPRPGGGTPLHVGTLRASGLLRRLGQSDMGLALHAVPSPDARLEPCALAEAGDAALEAWVAALSGRLPEDYPRPAGTRAIGLVSPATAMAAGQVLVARRQVTWAVPEGAGAVLFGQDTMSGLLVLPPDGWFAAAAEGRARVLTTAEARAEPGFAAALASAEAALLEQLVAASMLERVDELNRVAQEAAHRAEELADRRRRAALLAGRDIQEPADTSPADPHGLLAVAQLVAGRARTLRRPRRLRRGQADLVVTLAEIAQASELRLQSMVLRHGWWRRDAGPFLGERLDGTPVALTRDWRGYRMRNEALGIDKRVGAADAAGLRPEAIALVVPLPAHPVGILSLLPFGLRHPWRSVANLLWLVAAGALLGQAIPMATRHAFASVIPSRLEGALLELGIAVGLIAVVSALVTLTIEFLKLRTQSWGEAASFAALWDRVIRLPLPLLARYPAAELALRVSAAHVGPMGLRASGMSAATSLGFVLSSLGFIAYHQPVVGIAALAMVVTELLIAALSGLLQIRAFATGEKAEGLADSSVLQFVNGISKLRLAGAEDQAFGIWAGQFLTLRDKLVRSRRVVIVHESVLAGLGVLWTAALFAVVFLIAGGGQEGRPALSDVLAIVAAFATLVAANAGLSRVVVQLFFLVPPLKFGGEILAHVPEATTGLVDPGPLRGEITLSGVSFRYNADAPPLLHDVSLRIAPGEFIGIVGRSGAGKSTLAQLLLGFMPVSTGSIRIDGHDLQRLDAAAFRRQVGVVLQNGRIMPGTLLEAVRGTSAATEAEVWAGLESVSMAADVRAMPMGLHTLLTDASRLMSGGQVQRVLLARALVQKPALLILDEATSALDEVTQDAAMNAVVALPGTRIVIAHRLSTLRHADRILRIEEGGAVRFVTYEDLIS